MIQLSIFFEKTITGRLPPIVTNQYRRFIFFYGRYSDPRFLGNIDIDIHKRTYPFTEITQNIWVNIYFNKLRYSGYIVADQIEFGLVSDYTTLSFRIVEISAVTKCSTCIMLDEPKLVKIGPTGMKSKFWQQIMK